MKRKKPTPHQPRTNVYQRALGAAQKRIEKALIEKAACEMKLAQLNAEIPQLRKIIDVFEPERRDLINQKTWGRAVFDENTLALSKMTEEISAVYTPERIGTILGKSVPTERLIVSDSSPGVKPSPEALAKVPDHLKRFMQPTPEPIPDGEDPDRFLPDVE